MTDQSWNHVIEDGRAEESIYKMIKTHAQKTSTLKLVCGFISKIGWIKTLEDNRRRKLVYNRAPSISVDPIFEGYSLFFIFYLFTSKLIVGQWILKENRLWSQQIEVFHHSYFGPKCVYIKQSICKEELIKNTHMFFQPPVYV